MTRTRQVRGAPAVCKAIVGKYIKSATHLWVEAWSHSVSPEHAEGVRWRIDRGMPGLGWGCRCRRLELNVIRVILWHMFDGGDRPQEGIGYRGQGDWGGDFMTTRQNREIPVWDVGEAPQRSGGGSC